MENETGGRLDRRSFIKLAAGGVALGAAGVASFSELTKGDSTRRPVHLTSAVTGQVRSWHLVATDGYVAMPDPSIIAPVGVYYPDLLAPVDETGAGQNLYVFGFVDVTDINGFAGSNLAAPWDTSQLVNPIDFKGQTQISAPTLYCNDGDDIRIKLENLGFAVRPDLFDPHTIHWHGFANQIAYFDGVPDASLSVPSGSELTYRYLPTDVGTYMYHCHVEDVEHVHMGLTGMVFIRPHKNSPRWSAAGLPAGNPGNQKYAYYDASTVYDREFAILLTEANVENHWNDGHIQVSDWSEYSSTFGLLNGRSWPDTIEPNGSFFDRDLTSGSQPNGTWRDSQLSAAVQARLAHQPNSALIQANAGERVLLRVSNLGFDEHSLVLPGIEMTIVGRDAKFQGAGRPDYFPSGDPRDDIIRKTYRIDLGPGESRDILITAPAAAATTVYPFYDRSILFRKKAPSRTITGGSTTSGSPDLTTTVANTFTPSDGGWGITGPGIPANTTIAAYVDPTHVVLSNNATGGSGSYVLSPPATPEDGYGAMRTEVHIHPAGALGAQVHPNQLFV